MNIKNSIKYRLNKFIANINDIDTSITIPENCKIDNSQMYGDISLSNNTQIKKSLINGSIRINDGCYIESSKISGNINIGENCKLYNCELNGNIKLGKYTSLWGPNLDVITNIWNVEIGNFCSIARNVNIQIFNHNHKKITSYFIGQNLFKETWGNERISRGKTTIGNDVWIGAQCVILGGIIIGNGAVIAANSLVNNDVPPYAIMGGSPAKILGYRFNNDIVEILQEMQWWHWSKEKIKKNKHLFENELQSTNLQNIIK